ncbi:MAG: hypothetical protein KID02_07195 [Clostridiales bacterium]|nr:hypothetical protein [Clostridiales bacterium]
MTTKQQSKNSAQEKRKRIENIKLILAQRHDLKSAQDVCDAYSEKFSSSIPIASMSRYLSSPDFERHGNFYRVVIKDDETKKSEVLSSLLQNANAHIVSEYDILFISLTNDFSTTIAHYLENYSKISKHILGIIPCKKSLMIFCHIGYKQEVEKNINDLLSQKI